MVSVNPNGCKCLVNDSVVLTNMQDKWIKIGKGALIALAGALVIYIPEAVTTVDWGTWTPFAVAVASVVVNALRVFTQK